MDQNYKENLYQDSTLKNLKVKEKILSTACKNALTNLKCKDVDVFLHNLNENMKEEVIKVVTEWNAVYESLKKLYKNVVSKEKIQNLDIQYYKEHVEELWNQINNIIFFIGNNLKQLKENEISIEKEIIIAQRLYKSSNKMVLTKFTLTQLSDDVKKTNTYQEDSEKFQNFLTRTGGHSGGWNEEEHKQFQKIWSHYKFNILNEDNSKESEFSYKIQRILPGKSSEEIFLHSKWMNKYVELKELKDLALKNWKTIRNDNKNHVILNEIITDKRSLCDKTNKYELEQWRQSKNEEKREIERQMASVAINKREFEYLKQMNRKHEKAVINQWMDRKRLQSEESARRIFEKEKEVKKKMSIEANKKIKEYRKRDAFNLNKRMLSVQKRMEQQVMQFKKQQALKKKNTKNIKSNKYTAPTETWSKRILEKSKTKSKENIRINDIESIPKLCKPQWRKGLVVR